MADNSLIAQVDALMAKLDEGAKEYGGRTDECGRAVFGAVMTLSAPLAFYREEIEKYFGDGMELDADAQLRREELRKKYKEHLENCNKDLDELKEGTLKLLIKDQLNSISGLMTSISGLMTSISGFFGGEEGHDKID